MRLKLEMGRDQQNAIALRQWAVVATEDKSLASHHRKYPTPQIILGIIRYRFPGTLLLYRFLESAVQAFFADMARKVPRGF